MADRPRYYLTTSIAYANNKPGLHTLYEVIGADAIARWHRMLGDDTRFLTGTDEHSINIAQAAVDEGRPTREFVDEKVALFKTAEDALAIAPDRFIRTTDPDHVRAAQEMVRRAHANGDIYLGTYEGWYCPNEGFRNADRRRRDGRAARSARTTPTCPLQWLTERNWFFRLSAYQERLERHFADHPDFVQPDYRRNEMLGFIRGGLEDFSISRERTPGDWGIPFPIAENGETALREDGSWDPEAGKIYVWYDALINYITGAGFPDDPAAFAHWWPADLHVIGKDIARFHTIFWPAMLWSAGPRGAASRLGPRLAAGRRRRADEQEPRQLPRSERLRGGLRLRRRALRRPARGPVRSRRRGQLGLVRPALQRRPRQRLRQPRQPDGVDDQPLSRRGAAGAPRRRRLAARPRLGRRRSPPTASASTACLLHEALAELWAFVGGANKARRCRAAVGAGQGREGGRRGRRRRGCAACWATSSRRAGWSAWPPRRSCRRRRRGCSPSSATRTRTRPDGNGGPPILDELAWGAKAARPAG